MKINQPNPVNFFIKTLNISRKRDISSVEQNINNAVKDIDELTQWESNENGNIKKGPRWDLKKVPLKYYLEKDIFVEKLMKDFLNVTEEAFKTWASASSGLIRFERGLIKDVSDIIVSWNSETLPGRDYEAGRNDLKVINNKIERAEIKIMTFPLIDAGLSEKERIERVKRTALHEIGHALGLKHSKNPKDIMFHRGISNKNLSETDKKRLVEFYKSDSLNIIS